MKNILKGVKFLLKNRFILFFTFLIVFSLSYRIYSGSFLPSAETKDLWFYSGLFMVLFSILFIEPYYTSPKNVITNVIPLLLVFFSIKSYFTNQSFWWTAVFIFLVLLLFSALAMALEDKNKSPGHKINKVSNILKKLVAIIGRGKILYSAVFIYFLLTYHSIQNFYITLLFVFWFFIVILDVKNIHNSFFPKLIKKQDDQIGEIFGVQSKKIFLVKLFEDRKSIFKFDIVKFRYSMQAVEEMVITGIVFDTYLLNKEKWAKILQLKEEKQEEVKLEKNIVYKLTNKDKILEISKELRVEDFVGVVIEGSNIGKIKFEYSKKKDNIQEGDLLKLKISDKALFYQVINGTTERKKLEERNESSVINGEAVQLGEWCGEKLSFQKFGWVPSINTPIFKTDASEIMIDEFSHPNYKIGNIPNTKLPSVIDLNDAVSHHMALLGVTGSGKSFLAREIINQIKSDTKVICIDFNKEFITTLSPVPTDIVNPEIAKKISENIDWINNELEEFGNKQDKDQINTKQSEIKSLLKKEIETFINDNNYNVKVFELLDISNTTGVLDYTKYFFKVLFEIAKEKQIANSPVKICVVLEEAHTIIPEWNFSGSSDKTSQSLVNSIGQITLQGRKYGIGFLVIAQRTANVSKTVLTQCNTVVCFQAFDETSFSFLSNYVGKDLVQTLPNLKRFHAIVAGKATKSNMPMIIDLKR